MKIIHMLAVATVALSGVNSPALAQSGLSQQYLTGVWQETPQCNGNVGMVFFANGTMSSAGSTPVNYAVTGPSQITMHGPGGAVPFNIQYVNQDRMIVTFQNDASVFYRCGAQAANTHVQVSAAYVTGGWGHNGVCGRPEVFSAGGHMRTSTGDVGTWALFGNTLRVTVANGNSLDFAVQPNGQQNMTLTQTNNGQVSNYTRCF